jgi:hypothetical protein
VLTRKRQSEGTEGSAAARLRSGGPSRSEGDECAIGLPFDRGSVSWRDQYDQGVGLSAAVDAYLKSAAVGLAHAAQRHRTRSSS